MIKIYPVKVEAVDDDTSDLLFKMETLDSECAIVEMKTAITKQNMEKILTAVRSAVHMLELDDGKQKAK